MDRHFSENSESNFGTSSVISESNTRKNEGLDDSGESESTVVRKVQQKSHDELRIERINELNFEFQKYFSEIDYEKAITIMKKLIFFEPSSKSKLFLF